MLGRMYAASVLPASARLGSMVGVQHYITTHLRVADRQVHTSARTCSTRSSRYSIQMRGILCMETSARSKVLFSDTTAGWLIGRFLIASRRSRRYECHSYGAHVCLHEFRCVC